MVGPAYVANFAREPTGRSAGPGAERVAEHIRQRTWGRIHRLRVELADGRVVVHGRASSYHTKQLALAAVRELLDAVPVELDVQVAAQRRWPARDSADGWTDA